MSKWEIFDEKSREFFQSIFCRLNSRWWWARSHIIFETFWIAYFLRRRAEGGEGGGGVEEGVCTSGCPSVCPPQHCRVSFRAIVANLQKVKVFFQTIISYDELVWQSASSWRKLVLLSFVLPPYALGKMAASYVNWLRFPSIDIIRIRKNFQ